MHLPKQQPKQPPKQKPNNKESNSFSAKVEKGDNKTEDLTRWGDLQKKWGYMTIRRGDLLKESQIYYL